jgi:Fe2+ transport system protein FeoA
LGVREQQWEEEFAQLRAYSNANNDCLVPQSFEAEDGYQLGKWVSGQRTKKDTLSRERRRRLDELGFVWDVREQRWEEGFTRLQTYRESNSNCLVPFDFKTEDGYRLGVWINIQRIKKDTLSDVRRRRLNKLGFVWDVRERQWEEGFAHLRAYREPNSDCQVPQSFKTGDGYRLGQWVSVQRTKKDTLSRERQRRLDELGFVWNVREQRWEEGFTRLQTYRETNNDCQVPQSFKTGDGYRLGQWVSVQRTKKDTLSRERQRRLDELGFLWKATSITT